LTKGAKKFCILAFMSLPRNAPDSFYSDPETLIAS
jgi:hypothetical protein